MNTTLRALSVALAAALIAPSAFAATAAIPTIDFHIPGLGESKNLILLI
jgi:maltoporin